MSSNRAFEVGKGIAKDIYRYAIDDFQEWLKTQVVGIDNSTKEILVMVDNRWELATEVFKEQMNE